MTMRPDEALAQIRQIRGQLARQEVYRGMRAASVAGTALVAQVAALTQPLLVPLPEQTPSAWVLLWVCAALAAAALLLGQLAWSSARASSQERAATGAALAAFLPPIAVGALVTAPLVAHGDFDLLPGLWAIFAGLALFATRSMLPKASGAVASAYVLGGAATLLFLRGAAALSPWVMGTLFGAGQLAASVVLYWNLERVARDGEE
ncbi:MAG: hypothetical protein JNJ88_09685 [Planctomycetes bacterium]|nr:hypothetical protein [Planctomycetota bacterium]